MFIHDTKLAGSTTTRVARFNIQSMESARIAELLRPFLGDEQPSDALLQQVSIYVDLLFRWNAKINLTAVREPDNIVIRHFGESFFAARKLIGREQATEVMDIGSGAGFPGVPVKLLRPTISVQLVEAHSKKAAFLSEVIRELGLKGISVVNRRAEEICETASVVTLRAVERFARVLSVAAEKVATEGRLGLLIGREQMALAKEVLPGRWEESVEIPLSDSRILAIWKSHREVSD
jgi:16S rRNA (guanine527-N7)-methyltransferase